MSCVVGVVERGGVCMGADSACSGNTITLHGPASGKVFRSGPFLAAHVGTVIVGQVVRSLDVPDQGTLDIVDYLLREWVPAVRLALKEQDLWKVDPPEGSGHAGEFMLAAQGRLFTVACDMAVTEEARGYAACGSGSQVALGALWATEDLPTEERVRLALQSAADHCEGVRPPFVVEWTGPHLEAAA